MDKKQLRKLQAAGTEFIETNKQTQRALTDLTKRVQVGGEENVPGIQKELERIRGLVEKNGAWMKGAKQAIKGGTVEMEGEKFLKQLNAEARADIEAGIKDLFDLKKFSRFRRRALIELNGAYVHGLLVAAFLGKDDAVLKAKYLGAVKK